MIHQYGVNRVIMDGVQYLQCIVTIKDDEIIDFRTFTEEQPFTEWVGGTIEIIRKNNKMVIKR
ncbi:hypothetical protein [Marseilla massiliensis]|uniref:Uncharacterized protein n=1 Tax=Marseilla massiliensis TaxID=1841864 RepID=A0A939B715_9BACT|nr:hypothetical protein [Marseilla massiliensis]MBM6673301.1 hypothetical protein [Marseilla massiliensis]